MSVDEKGLHKKQKKPAAAGAFVRYTNQVTNTVLRGIKMAGPEVYNPLASPLYLLGIIKQLGPQSLAWRPETLFAAIDRQFGGWSGEKVATALEHFHSTGELKTDVPDLVRHKLYAIRIILTSDSAHHEWNVFEKVGGAFNNRLANFGVVEPLTPAECATTIAIIDSVRPDTFSNEIKAYTAASSHQEGLYTIKPSKYLKMGEEYLSGMNKSETGRATDDKIVEQIANRLSGLKQQAPSLVTPPAEEFVNLQAVRLLAIDASGDNALQEA